MKISILGLSIKSIVKTFDNPMALRLIIIPDKLHLRISGSVFSTKFSKVSKVYILKHLPPSCSRPALPALYVAEFFEIGLIFKISIPVEG